MSRDSAFPAVRLTNAFFLGVLRFFDFVLRVHVVALCFFLTAGARFAHDCVLLYVVSLFFGFVLVDGFAAGALRP